MQEKRIREKGLVGTRVFRHSFQVNVSLEKVADFHSWADSMGAITPPPAFIRMHRAPERLSEGDELEFTLWLGPLPVHWRARIEHVSATGFTDRQIYGPFERWTHRHSFVPSGMDQTEVQDEIHLQARRHPFWGPLCWFLILNLPVLFAYRGWRTKSLLESDDFSHIELG